MRAILSLDVGGTKISAAAMTADGLTLEHRSPPAPPAQGPERMVARLLDLSRAVLRAAGLPASTVGISIGGPLDPVAGVVLRPPNLPGWDGTPLRAMLAEGLGIPPAQVHMENDGNACALAELYFGAARGRHHAIYLTMSTGIGGGLILDGRLYRGARFNAGEVGHQIVAPGGPRCGCGGTGCLEAVASGTGLASRLRADFDHLPQSMREAAGSPAGVSVEHLLEAARRAEPYAIGLLQETALVLARGIANLVFILNPEIVILGTIGYYAGDLLLAPLRAEVHRLCWPVLTEGLEIVASPLGPRLEDLSGLAVVLEAERRGVPPA